MTADEVRIKLGMGESAFYKLKQKAGMTGYRGDYTEEDFQVLLQRKSKYKPKAQNYPKWKISVWDGRHYIVKHVGLTQTEARYLLRNYDAAVAIECGGKKRIIKKWLDSMNLKMSN